jgi:cytochrome P450
VVGRRVRSPRALAEDVTARVAATAKRLADDLPVGDEVDLRETYAVWIPLLVMCELTGIDDAAWLRRWYESMMATATGGRSYDDVLIAGLRAINDLKDRIGPTLAERRRAPTGDIISDLVHTTFEDKPLRDQEIVVVAAQLFGATMETTERALTNSFRLLATDGAMYDRLRSQRGDDEALASFGAESLRLYSPIQATIRGAVRPTRVAGRRFIEGERIVAVLASANRDERRFAAASTFDPDRFVQNPDRQYTSAGDILPFGAGEHHCVGSRLARVLIVEALRHVLDRAGGIELLEDAPDTGGLVFWSPASLRVRLRPPT